MDNSDIFSQGCDDPGIDDVRFHDLRHTFASYPSQNGIVLRAISKLLGQKGIRMAQRYAHLSIENLKRKLSRHRQTKILQFSHIWGDKAGCLVLSL